MLEIESIEKVITERSLVVTIDEDEIAKILVDPREFQKRLRAERAKWAMSSQRAMNGHHAPGRKMRKARVARKSAEKKRGGAASWRASGAGSRSNWLERRRTTRRNARSGILERWHRRSTNRVKH